MARIWEIIDTPHANTSMSAPAPTLRIFSYALAIGCSIPGVACLVAYGMTSTNGYAIVGILFEYAALKITALAIVFSMFVLKRGVGVDHAVANGHGTHVACPVN